MKKKRPGIVHLAPRHQGAHAGKTTTVGKGRADLSLSEERLADNENCPEYKKCFNAAVAEDRERVCKFPCPKLRGTWDDAAEVLYDSTPLNMAEARAR